MTPRYVPETHELDALRRLARRLTRGDFQSAEDLVQETLLVVLRLDRPIERPHVGWLLGVARNVFRNQRRGEKRRLARERANPPSSPNEDPIRFAERAELAQVLERAVSRLPEHYRSVLVHRFRDGLSSEIIAQRLAIAPASVRSRVLRALDLLRSRLDRRAVAIVPGLPWRRLSRMRIVRCGAVAAGFTVASVLVFEASSASRMESPVTTVPRAFAFAATSTAVAPPSPTLVETVDPISRVAEAARAESKLEESFASGTKIVGRVDGVAPDLPLTVMPRLEVRKGVMDPDLPVIEASIAPDGSFVFDLSPWDSLRPLVRGAFLRLDDPGYAPVVRHVEFIDAHGRFCEGIVELPEPVSLRPASAVFGRVVDDEGAPIPNAPVVARFIATDGQVEPPTERADSAVDGSFRLRVDRPGTWQFVAHSPAGRRSRPVRVLLAARDETEMELVVSRDAPEVDSNETANRPRLPPKLPLEAIVAVRPVDRAGRTFERASAVLGDSGLVPGQTRLRGSYFLPGRAIGDGWFEFEVPIGDQAIEVLAGAATPVDAVFLPQRFEFALVRGERIERRFVAEEGGRLFARALARDGSGGRTRIAEVRDAAENVIVRRFHTLAPGDSYGDGRLSTFDYSRADVPIPPGSYTLIVSPGEPFETRASFAIAPLETTYLTVKVD